MGVRDLEIGDFRDFGGGALGTWGFRDLGFRLRDGVLGVATGSLRMGPSKGDPL